MKRAELGIGFIAGRKNVCDIINNYYKKLLEQIEGQANLTFFILYDLEYNGLEKEDFYNINPKVYKSGIKVQYIGEEEIQLEKNRIQEKHHLNKKEVDLVIGHGYGKARNTIMYWALKNNIDYLMFWDDDEYPVACIKDADTKKLIWKEQCNIKEHLKNIMNNDITIGYRCGYDAPIPYIEYDNTVTEEDFKDFIDGISNEVIHWKSIQKKVIEQKGITYADKLHLEEKPARTSEWIYGSGICINLKRIDKIPAFYNPPNARGEDTFFSIQLKDANICKVPIYHFHDGFLQYKDIMKEKYPQKLDKIKLGSKDIEKRFFQCKYRLD